MYPSAMVAQTPNFRLSKINNKTRKLDNVKLQGQEPITYDGLLTRVIVRNLNLKKMTDIYSLHFLAWIPLWWIV